MRVLIPSALRSYTEAAVAEARGATLAQLAVQWVLRDEVVTSALVGASRPQQIEESVAAVGQPPLSADELARIDAILAERVA